MHDGINRADILSCFLYMRVYSTEPPEEGDLPPVFFVKLLKKIKIVSQYIQTKKKPIVLL